MNSENSQSCMIAIPASRDSSLQKKSKNYIRLFNFTYYFM